MNPYNPLVSVIMPVFNSARYIAMAIESVTRQKYIEWELVIVDGGSEDDTRDIVNGFSASDSRIKLIDNHGDKGPGHARSVGVSFALGHYIAFLDADDVWLPQKLSNQIRFMLASNCVFTYTQFYPMDDEGIRLSCAPSIHDEYGYPSYLFFRGIACSSVIAKREVFTSRILESYGIFLAEDTYWWIVIFKQGVRAVGVREPLLLYRNTEGSLSKNRLYNQACVWKMYRQDMGLNTVYAGAAYISYILDVALRRFRALLCTIIYGKKKVNELYQ
jgi:teichuronic acid biosynthesis glycosyltransferase TuaG